MWHRSSTENESHCWAVTCPKCGNRWTLQSIGVNGNDGSASTAVLMQSSHLVHAIVGVGKCWERQEPFNISKVRWMCFGRMEHILHIIAWWLENDADLCYTGTWWATQNQFNRGPMGDSTHHHFHAYYLGASGSICSSLYHRLVLGKFGLKPIQTRFKPNWNRKFWFQFQDFVKIPDGSVFGLGNPKFLQTISNSVWTKPNWKFWFQFLLKRTVARAAETS